MTTAATKIALLTLSIPAAAALAAERFVTTAGAYPAAGANADGVTSTAATAAGELVPVDVVGTSIVVAAGAIAKDAYVQVGANGKAATKTTGIAVAKALQAATADGDRIAVLLIPNAPAPTP